MKTKDFLGITGTETSYNLEIKSNNKTIGYISNEFNDLPYESKMKILLDLSSWINSEILKIKQTK